ncbi:hypothetical protein ScPMuIL_010881 [Solemya velum]
MCCKTLEIIMQRLRNYGCVAVTLFVVLPAPATPNRPYLRDFTRSQILEFSSQKSNNLPPNFNDDIATTVKCDLYVDSFDSINEATMDFTVSALLHLTWDDHRFTSFFKTDNNDSFIEFDSKNLEKLWVPDIYFSNEKTASFHDVFMPNKMLRIYAGMRMSYISRLSLTLSCPMDLRAYPFDKQVCRIEVGSFGYNMDNIILEWREVTADGGKPVEYNENITLPQFDLIKTDYSSYFKEQRASGNHSCLKAEFHLVRNIGYYMVQMYIPSMLVVVISWISFWLNVDSAAGRISLGVLTVLTMTTQSSGVNASLPRVSYTKAIDIWMSTCLLFVFSALIEFAVANVLSRKDMNKNISFKNILRIPKDDDSGTPSKTTLVNRDGDVRMDYDSSPTYNRRNRRLSGLMYSMRRKLIARECNPYLQIVDLRMTNGEQTDHSTLRLPEPWLVEPLDKPTQESLGTLTQETLGTPTQETLGTPAREPLGTSTQGKLDTSAIEPIDTPTQRTLCTPAQRQIDISTHESLGTPIQEPLDTPT